LFLRFYIREKKNKNRRRRKNLAKVRANIKAVVKLRRKQLPSQILGEEKVRWEWQQKQKPTMTEELMIWRP
jgi:hypothetical protein